LFSP